MNEEELAKKANDFEEEHGWSPDIGYEVIETKPKKKKKEPKLTPKQEKWVLEYVKNGSNGSQVRFWNVKEEEECES